MSTGHSPLNTKWSGRITSRLFSLSVHNNLNKVNLVCKIKFELLTL